MPELSQTEENYLKAIFTLRRQSNSKVSTNDLAGYLETAAASVTDMLKRLADKKLIRYERYKGVELSDKGENLATQLIRKHRLWESFLFEKLNFDWHEVHDIAEQLEHIRSEELTDRLDRFLGFPKFDPHGDPIPDKEGNFAKRSKLLLSELEEGDSGVIVGVKDSEDSFLEYLNQIGIGLGDKLKIKTVYSFDQSVELLLDEKRKISMSRMACENIFIKPG